MSNHSILTKAQTRKILLYCGGVTKEHCFKNSLSVVDYLGYVQIDTISVIERAHNHIIFSRFQNHKTDVLNNLVKSKDVFEYWSHAASFLPINDYRFSLPRKKRLSTIENHWFKKDKKVMKQVLTQIEKKGPLQAKDFERDEPKKSGPWFEWKPAKKALEQLFMEGKLMVSERKGFQKVYDLTERVLPKNIDTTFPSKIEQGFYLVNRALNLNGIITKKEISYLRRNVSDCIGLALKEMLKKKEILKIQIKDCPEEEFYILPDLIEKKIRLKKSFTILSPFDPIVIQRARLKRFFDFDYQIECYLPALKRKYGYFCLPILLNDQFLGRVDLKAHRKEKILSVNALHFSSTVKNKQEALRSFTPSLLDFAQFNGCTNLVFDKT